MTVNYSYPAWARILHMGLAVFGIGAFLTGELAEDGMASGGYLIHAYLGLSLATFALLRLLRGFVGGGQMGFRSWSPLDPKQWVMAGEDLLSLIRWRVPERGMHEGLAGLTQAFGLAVFAWMGATGTALFLLAGSTGGIFGLIEEVHEVGEALIPLYLALHVGSVVLHSLAGRPIWQKMWTFRSNGNHTISDASARS